MTLKRRETFHVQAIISTPVRRLKGKKSDEKTYLKKEKTRHSPNQRSILWKRIYAHLERKIALNVFCFFSLLCFLKKFISPSIAHPKFLRNGQSGQSGRELQSSKDLPVLLSVPISVTSKFHPPAAAQFLGEPDPGGLDIQFPEENESRVITDSSFSMDDFYLAFDDDKVRDRGWHQYEGLHCSYTDWHRELFPTCNTFHELDIINSSHDVRYLASGNYRSVFKIHPGNNSEVAIKTIRYDRKKFSLDIWESVRMDAIVMEKLTKSPRIADIYGHCAFAIMTEFLPYDLETLSYYGTGFIEMDKIDEEINNEFQEDEKLELALAMAEAIADLHGFEDGIIIHDDIQLCQFLFTRDYKLKLNDFNRAEIMLFDEKRNMYCRYQNGVGGGNLRAPEEYKDEPLNEKIDVWSFGTNVYTLLTGLWVYFDEQDYYQVSRRVKQGQKPYIHNKFRNGSFPERVLVQVLDRCFEYNPDDRADIFEIIQLLRKGIDENKRKSADQK